MGRAVTSGRIGGLAEHLHLGWGTGIDRAGLACVDRHPHPDGVEPDQFDEDRAGGNRLARPGHVRSARWRCPAPRCRRRPLDVPLRVASATRSRAALSSASATASSAWASSRERRLPEPSLTSRSARWTLSAAASRRAVAVSTACWASTAASRSEGWIGTSRNNVCPRVTAGAGRRNLGRACSVPGDGRGNRECRPGRSHDLAAHRPGARHGAPCHRLCLDRQPPLRVLAEGHGRQLSFLDGRRHGGGLGGRRRRGLITTTAGEAQAQHRRSGL